jgi:hypothetical protein
MPRVQRGYQDPPFSGYFDKSECLDWIDLQEQIMKTGIEAAGELPRSPQRFFPPKSSNFLQIHTPESIGDCRKTGNITQTSHSSRKPLIITLLRHAASGQTRHQSERQFHR